MSFSVWDAASIALKTLTYGTTLTAAGAIFFLNYSHALIRSADRLRIRRIAAVLGILAVIASVAQIVVIAGSMGGDATSMLSAPLVSMVWHAGQSHAVGVRALGLTLALAAARAQRPPAWPAWPAWAAWRAGPAMVGAILAASSFAWVGHAKSLSPDVLPIALLGIHLIGVAFWLGALWPLLIVSRHDNVAAIAAIAARFSLVATFVVAALTAAGIGLLWMLLGEFSQLWLSAYGRYILFKLFLVAGLLCCAAYNKWRLTPRLRMGDVGAVRSLRTSLRVEMLLGGLILMMTAVFTTVVGPPVLE